MSIHTNGENRTHIDKFRKLVKWQKQIGATVPGPKCHPLMGNLPEMVEAKGFSEELFRKLHAE